MSLASVNDVNDEIKSICSILDGPEPTWGYLGSRAFHLADAIASSGPALWAHIDWQGFLRVFAESGIAYDILGQGECVAWAGAAGLIAPAFCFEWQRQSAFEKMAWLAPSIATLVLAGPAHWGSWIEPGMENLFAGDGYAKPTFGSWMAQLCVKGFEPPLLVDQAKGMPGGQISHRFMAHGVDAQLDKAESGGMLAFFKQTGRLEPWAALCMLHGNEERLGRAIAAGADFSALNSKQSWGLFRGLIGAAGPGARQAAMGYGSCKKKQVDAAIAWDAALKKKMWLMAIEAGMPVARCEKSELARFLGIDRGWRGDASGLLARAEMERGGLNGSVAMGWLLNASMNAMDFAAFDGSHPVLWGLAHGLSLGDVEKGSMMDAAILGGGAHEANALLIGLAGVGAKLEGSERGEYHNDEGSLLGYLMHLGASPEAVGAAIEIGVDWRARNGVGDPALSQLFGFARGGDYDAKLAAIVAAVGSEHVAELLAQKDKDGAGPMHWAARALCPASIKALRDLGLDPNDKDAKGASAGHWAARKYGAGKEGKISATLSQLTRCGQNWKALDSKGKSALAALCARGPLEPVAALLDQAPEAMEAKGSSGKSAKEALIKRSVQEPRAGAMVERSELSVEVGQEPKDKPIPKTRGRRI